VENEDAFWNSILEFYNIEKSLFKFKPFKPEEHLNPLVEGELHYRNSRLDEWREVFTVEQCKKSTELIPEWLFKRFKWSK